MGLSGSKKRVGKHRPWARMARAGVDYAEAWRVEEEDREIRLQRRGGFVTSREDSYKNAKRLPKGAGKGRYCVLQSDKQYHWNTDAYLGQSHQKVRCFTKKRLAQKHAAAQNRLNAPAHGDGPEFSVVDRNAMRWNRKGKYPLRQYPRGRQKSGLPRAAEFMRPSSPDDLPF